MVSKVRNKVVGMVAIVIIATIGITAILISRIGEIGQKAKDESPVHEVKRRRLSDVKRTDKPKPALVIHRIQTSGASKETEDDEDDGMTPEERKLAGAIEKALDEEDLVSVRALVGQAMASTNTEIRQSMVDALGWFGVKALPELTPFLVDPDEDVRDSARNEWSMAVSEIENDSEKISVVELAMHVLTDEDMLEDMSNEYIGIDEKLAVESLLKIIESDGSQEGIAKAKETYEFVTGEEFTDRAAAEKWVVEEYEPSP